MICHVTVSQRLRMRKPEISSLELLCFRKKKAQIVRVHACVCVISKIQLPKCSPHRKVIPDIVQEYKATIDRPGNIPVVIAYPTTLYKTHKETQQELTLPLGTVVNAVFKNQQWLYVQTPHGDEGYVLYSACLPLGILPNRPSPQKKTPCWESSTDIYPRPCGNLTDNEKEQLRGRTRSECRYKPAKRKPKGTLSCAEKDFDTLYLKTKSFCSEIDKIGKENVSVKSKLQRQILLVVNSDYRGSVLNKTLSVNQGDVVVLLQGGGAEADVDAEWFYVKKRDGSHGFIPAAIAGHGYI